MRWGHNRKLEFYLNYDERTRKWKAHVQESNRYGFTRTFKTCQEANEWYAKYKEEYKRLHGINF